MAQPAEAFLRPLLEQLFLDQLFCQCVDDRQERVVNFLELERPRAAALVLDTVHVEAAAEALRELDDLLILAGEELDVGDVCAKRSP